MTLKDELESGRGVLDRLDRVIYATSFGALIAEEHMRCNSTAQTCGKLCKYFYDNIPPFGQWLNLTERKNWEQRLDEFYKKHEESMHKEIM